MLRLLVRRNEPGCREGAISSGTECRPLLESKPTFFCCCLIEGRRVRGEERRPGMLREKWTVAVCRVSDHDETVLCLIELPFKGSYALNDLLQLLTRSHSLT